MLRAEMRAELERGLTDLPEQAGGSQGEPGSWEQGRRCGEMPQGQGDVVAVPMTLLCC